MCEVANSIKKNHCPMKIQQESVLHKIEYTSKLGVATFTPLLYNIV